MDISIIIPNLNSPIINQTIDSLLRQNTYDSYEIIVVGLDKFGVVEKYSNQHVRFLKTDNPTPPAIARNIGANSSKGNLIIFIDADCVADKKLFMEHTLAHNNMADKLVGGAVRVQPNDNYWILSDNISTFHEVLNHTKAGKRDILPSLNLSISHSLWETLGGFDSKYPTAAGEDADFSFRARQCGAELYFAPNAIVNHFHQRGSFQSVINHAFNFGKFSIKLTPDYLKRKNIPKFVLKFSWVLVLLSPLLSFMVIMKIIFLEKLPVKYWHTLPVVFLCKIAWCFGAAKRRL